MIWKVSNVKREIHKQRSLEQWVFFLWLDSQLSDASSGSPLCPDTAGLWFLLLTFYHRLVKLHYVVGRAELLVNLPTTILIAKCQCPEELRDRKVGLFLEPDTLVLESGYEWLTSHQASATDEKGKFYVGGEWWNWTVGQCGLSDSTVVS